LTPTRPPAAEEIRLLSLSALRGANYWSRAPVTRLDLDVGAYDEISSAEVPSLGDRLRQALPGLSEHRCSVGRRGGFLERLERGTYAPHIIEHVALELQTSIGHPVSFGRARGGERTGVYTVVVEHRHAGVGVRAVGLAVDLVQRAFDGTLDGAADAIGELRPLADTPDATRPTLRAACAITGSRGRPELLSELKHAGIGGAAPIVELSPSYLLAAGLPFATSDLAVILDAEVAGVPEPYREPDRARQLASVVAEGVAEGGVTILPAGDELLLDLVRRTGSRTAVFAPGPSVDPGVAETSVAVAEVRGGEVLVRTDGSERTFRVHDRCALPVQAAAALAIALSPGADPEQRPRAPIA